MLRAFVTALIAALGTMGFAHAHSDKPKEAAEKKAAHGKHAGKKDHDKDKHGGGDHGKQERKQ